MYCEKALAGILLVGCNCPIKAVTWACNLVISISICAFFIPHSLALSCSCSCSALTHVLLLSSFSVISESEVVEWLVFCSSFNCSTNLESSCFVLISLMYSFSVSVVHMLKYFLHSKTPGHLNPCCLFICCSRNVLLIYYCFLSWIAFE